MHNSLELADSKKRSKSREGREGRRGNEAEAATESHSLVSCCPGDLVALVSDMFLCKVHKMKPFSGSLNAPHMPSGKPQQQQQ